MARQTYPVGGQRFGKRGDLPDHIRGIVAKHQDDEPIGEADLAFVADLLGNHPHANVKGGVGVASIVVRHNPLYRSTAASVFPGRADPAQTLAGMSASAQHRSAKRLSHSKRASRSSGACTSS